MRNRTTTISAFVLLLLLAAACDRKSEQPQSATSPSKDESAAPTPVPTEPKPASAAEGKPKDEAAPIWPDGYIVVSEEEWIPVINQAGAKLEAARKSFVAGDKKTAAVNLRDAAKAFRDDENIASSKEKDKLVQGAKTLDVLAEKLASDQSVSRKDFERTLTAAYREDAGISWLDAKDEVVRPFFERPSEHSARALRLLAEHDNADAAAEIRRSTAYFRLAELSARADDRQLLQQNVDRLNAMAKKADAGKLTADELRKTLAQVDAAYASSYLHQAEARYEAKDAQHAPRSLREAAAHMRSRLRSLGKETEAGSHAVVDDLEALAGKLEHGTKSAAKHVSSLFKRAHKQVKTEPGAGPRSGNDTATPHG